MSEDLSPAHIESLVQQLLRLKSGTEIIAFRQGLTKAQARAVIKHPLLPPVDRASISLAIQFQGEQRIQDRYHWAKDVNFGDSCIFDGDAEPDPSRPR
jgi:hypothetical protein